MVVEVIQPMVEDIFKRLVGEPQYIGFFSLLIVIILMLRMKAPAELTIMGSAVWVLVGGRIGLFSNEILVIAALILAGMAALGFVRWLGR